MTRYRELMDAEIGVAPPSTIDVEAVITRQRRMMRTQRAGVSVAAAVAAIGLVVGIGVLQQTGSARSPDVAAFPSPSPVDPRQAEMNRLTAELLPLVQQLLPNSQFQAWPQDDGPTGDALEFADREDYFLAAALVSDAKGTGSLRVTTGNIEERFGSAECSSDPAPLDVKLTCDTKAGPDGATVMRLTMTRNKFVRYFIYVQRTDGRGVAVEVTNGGDDFVSQRPNPPLNRDQASQLALQPALASTL